jgi:hypothetical protein
VVKEENSSKVILSDTCIEYLMEWYAWKAEGMIPVGKEAMEIMAIQKGKQCQTEAMDMLSILDDEAYTENKEQVANLYLTGEPDAYKGKTIWEATHISDQKNMWDYPTFLKSINQSLENGYKTQIQGYGNIVSCPSLTIDKILCSNPQDIINDMKFKVAKKFGAMTTESPDFLKEWEKWERSMIFDSIPIHKRVFRTKVEPFTAFEQQKVYDRVKVCREWLAAFHETYIKMNL